MKKYGKYFLVFIVLILMFGFYHRPVHKTNSPAPTFNTVNEAIKYTHKTSYHTGQEVMFGSSMCTATAIGPHALLTATHCELPSEELALINVKKIVKIEGRLRDGNDHTIYIISGYTFKDYAKINLADPLEQSEDVFIWGNPGQWNDMFRKGYIAGTRKDQSIFAALMGYGKPDMIMMDFQDWHGDSGSGVFNTSGELIAVVSTHDIQASDDDPKDSIRFTGCFKLGFTQHQIDLALNM